MRIPLLLAALTLSAPLSAADPAPFPAPSEIVAAAPAADWVSIAPSDLLVMDLSPDDKGKERRVVIQLMPAPFSQGWIGNIRKLAAARFWDGLAVTRVQDNYVAQWGDPDGEDKAKVRKLPEGLAVMSEGDYISHRPPVSLIWTGMGQQRMPRIVGPIVPLPNPQRVVDPYASNFAFASGIPLAVNPQIEQIEQLSVVTGLKGIVRQSVVETAWPVHCYGMVGVGRNMSPDTGTGAELYTVIGHAPRHLDRNIALVGRVIEGIEHLSSMPRGHGPLGTYDKALGDELVPISKVRIGSEVPGLPAFQYLSTESETFARYADARANRRDPFFIRPAGGADICNIPVPVRRSTGSR